MELLRMFARYILTFHDCPHGYRRRYFAEGLYYIGCAMFVALVLCMGLALVSVAL